MKELLRHLPAIKNFVVERTQALQEISEQVFKNFLREAYKLPFLFPVRIIVNEDKFVNFLFDMRKDLLEGKKIAIAEQKMLEDTTKSEQVEEPKIAVKKVKATTKKSEVQVDTLTEKKRTAKKEPAKKIAVSQITTTKKVVKTPKANKLVSVK